MFKIKRNKNEMSYTVKSSFEMEYVTKNGKSKCSSRLGIHSFIILFGLLSMVSWGLYTTFISQVTNIEKSFGLTSSETGWLLTVWEIGYVACNTIAGYFSSRIHIPRMLGFVTIVCGISGLVCALPHFVAFEDPQLPLSSNYSTNGDTSIASLCLSQTNTTEAPLTEAEMNIGVSKKTLAFTLLNIGMVLMGVGKAPCYPYSSQYIDDNTDKKNTGLYISIAGSISIFGLAVGYGVGSLISKVYVTLKPIDLHSMDSRFVGAWWLGLVVLGFCCFIAALPMFLFPRSIRVTNKASIVSTKRTQDARYSVLQKEIKTALKAVIQILQTPVFMLTLVGESLRVFAFTTFFGFEPKYMETQFAESAWKSNIILGVSSILSYCIGSIIGGYATKRYKMTPFTMLRTIVLILVAVNIIEIGMAFIGCPQREIIPPASNTGFGCDCTSQQFLPICGVDNKNYFSPCHAGCTNGTLSDFTDCRFIPGGTAKSGYCPSDCSMVWVYAVVKFIQNMTDAIATTPIFLVFLRSTGDEKKGFAVALSAALTTLFARLPSPVIGGKVIDTTCLIWKATSTSGKYCGHYDTAYQRQLLHGLRFGIRAASIMVIGAAMFKAKHIPDDWRVDETKKTKDNQEQQELTHFI